MDRGWKKTLQHKLSIGAIATAPIFGCIAGDTIYVWMQRKDLERRAGRKLVEYCVTDHKPYKRTFFGVVYADGIKEEKRCEYWLPPLPR